MRRVRRHSRHRLWQRAVGGLTVAGMLAAGAVGTANAEEPGGAAPIPVAFTGPDSFDLSLQAGEPAEGEAQIEVGLKGPGEADPDHEGVILPIHQGKYTVTIDATGLEGVADVDLPCDADGLVAVCTEYELYAGDVYNRNWDIGLAPGAESEAGDTGTITVTGEGEGLEFTEHSIDVLVGGPEFRMRALTEPEGFAAGDTFEAPLGFRNVGGVAADGVILRFTGSRGLSFPQEYGNCAYAVENEDNLIRMRRVALCAFEGTFEKDTSYEVGEPVKVSTADFALNDVFSYSFTALSPEEADRLRAGGDYRQGKGAELTLRQAKGDGDHVRYAELDFPTKNTYDLDLTGDRADGKKGETVAVDVTMHNRGPGWIGSLRAGGEPIGFTVDIPEGATVAKAPRACGPHNVEGVEQPGSYLCWAGTPMLEDSREDFAFELRIDKVVEGAKGRIHMPKWDNPWEGNPANDDGWIVLNGTGDEETPGDGDSTGSTGGTGGTGGSGSEGKGGDGEDGGEGGGEGDGGSNGSTGTSGTSGGESADGRLASTGTTALTAGGLALLLLAAGGTAVVTVRRRRAAGAGAGGTGGAAA
ncbi:hypothetical protein [Streptomyces sp. enrichment culture]|uniref:hypothetical protein n=1 Tax=Streptomyces sp. enrichment culture TaxID=1795815 RepID=UPI003F550FFA